MKLVIENTTFDFEVGSRLLKLKYETCPFPELKKDWDKIKPMTFGEIASLTNLEQRRVGIICLGTERLLKEVNPTLINKQTLDKTTTFVDEKGKVVTKKFKDTYELFEVSADYFNKGLDSWRKMENCHFVRCKDTSTDREYLIWVDLKKVGVANGQENYSFDKNKVNAIQSIAWTIQTTVPKGNIEKIIRQGDCVMVKPKDASLELLTEPRHLTEKEYRTLLVAES